VEKLAIPGGGPGGLHLSALTPVASARGKVMLLPITFWLPQVAHGFSSAEQRWTCSPTMIVFDAPSGMAVRRVSRDIGTS
jgi:hypothetical protein